MSPHQGFRVASTTTGIASSPFEHLRVNYRYGGSGCDEDEIVSASLAESSGARKRRRLEILAVLDAISPPLSLAEVARRMQIAPRTVRGYRAELERQRRGGSS